MPEPVVVPAMDLDFEGFARLQREAFADVFAGSGTVVRQSADYFRWKYAPPFGAAKIALVYDGDRLVAANSMYPLRLRVDGGAVTVWQSCDTATHPSARGRGYFLACLRALKKELGPQEIFFGFPNGNSIHGFTKFGWTVHGQLRTSVRFVAPRRRPTDSGVAPVARFDERQDRLAQRLHSSGAPMLDRTAASMNWRYFTNPLDRYEALAVEDGNEWAGVIVVRVATVRGKPTALVMELLSTDPGTERRLLLAARSWASTQDASRLVMMNNTVPLLHALRRLWLPIPDRLLSTRHVLMGDAQGAEGRALLGRAWRIHLGDGIGF